MEHYTEPRFHVGDYIEPESGVIKKHVSKGFRITSIVNLGDGRYVYNGAGKSTTGDGWKLRT